MTAPEHALFPAPSLLDPRLMLIVPRDARPAMTALWQLDARFFAVVAGRREDMLAQLKLAWWRDRLRQLADDPEGLPRGEPLLRDLARSWNGTDALVDMVDGYESAMLAETDDQAEAAAGELATAMQSAMTQLGQGPLPNAWAMVRAAQMVPSKTLAEALWRGAASVGLVQDSPRAILTLERWALLVARHDGSPPPRAEGWLLLRAGLGY